MTQDKKTRQLIDMYEALLSQSALEIAPLIIKCLEIITLTCEHERFSRLIAKDLKLIMPSNKALTLNALMRESIVHVEAGLEPHMRGFSNLYDEVVEENILRIDMQELIKNMRGQHQELALLFQEVIYKFDVYEALSDFCGENKKIFVLIFLNFLKKIFLIINLSENILEFWLSNWSVCKSILNSYKNSHDLSDKNNLLLFLCTCSSENIKLSKNKALKLEEALLKAQLPSLELFIENGFLSVESALISLPNKFL